MDLSNYDELRTGAGLIARDERGRILLTGPDRRSFLQGLVTNDLASLEAGDGVYAAWLTPQGRMIADVNAIELGDALLMDVPRDLTPALLTRLDESIFAEDVAVADASAEWGQVAIAGPEAETIVNAVGRASTIVPWRADGLGVSLFELYVKAAEMPAVQAALGAAGAKPVGVDAAETFRIEAGIPRWGLDLDEDTIPLEAGIESRAVSFTKGCYVGQEVIVRVLHRGGGRVARRLVPLDLPGTSADGLPARGAALTSDGRQAGRLTSVAWSPRAGHGVALGYVHRDFVAAGTKLDTSVGRAVVRGDRSQ
jgi:folate-binding protein YgfZ